MKLLLTFILSLTSIFGFSEETLAMIKPDAIAANHIGEIVTRFEKGGLSIIGAKMTSLTVSNAEEFYAAHKERPYFNDLIAYITSGPVFVMTLQGDDAINRARSLIGATDPKKAVKGTIRADFGTDIQKNAIHGSDSPQAAKTEIAFFFEQEELYPR